MSASALTLYLINRGGGDIETAQLVKLRGERVCPHIKARLEKKHRTSRGAGLSLGHHQKTAAPASRSSFMRRSRAGPAPKILTENMNPFHLQMQGSGASGFDHFWCKNVSK